MGAIVAHAGAPASVERRRRVVGEVTVCRDAAPATARRLIVRENVVRDARGAERFPDAMVVLAATPNGHCVERIASAAIPGRESTNGTNLVAQPDGTLLGVRSHDQQREEIRCTLGAPRP